MSSLIVEGGHRLQGEIAVGGAKNMALKAIAASVLSPDTMTLHRLPEIEDVKRQLEILESLGAKVVRQERGVYSINTSAMQGGELPHEIVAKLRASIVLTGPILGRFGTVAIAHPGGCKIGRRPIDLFLRGFRALGAEVEEHPGVAYRLRAKHLRGARIVFPTVSVTATETMMLAAVLAEGTTELVNAALEPEIRVLAEYLNSQGARILGAGTPTISIEGVPGIRAGTITMIPDRIEAGSFAIIGVAIGSHLKITQCEPLHLEVLIAVLREAGAELKVGSDFIEVVGEHKLQAVPITTHAYPGFVTDFQSAMTVLLTQAHGNSLVHETIFEGRLFFTDTLNQMGADITLCDPHRAIVRGPTPLEGRTIESPDARAGLALLLAALVARGTSTIQNVYQIDRGYEHLDARLAAVGAHVRRQ